MFLSPKVDLRRSHSFLSPTVSFLVLLGPYHEQPLKCENAVFGWEVPNVRLLADEYAKAGFYCYVPDVLNGDPLPMTFLDNVEPNVKTQESLSVTDKAKNAAIVPATLGTWLPKHTEGVTKPLIDGFINTVRMTPGTNKVGAIGFCWGGRYAILEAHGQKKDGSGSDVGGVDAAMACHPSLVAVPGDFDPVSIPLSLAVGTKDSLLDQATVGKIQDLMAKKVELPHELRVRPSFLLPYPLTHGYPRSMKIRFMDSPFVRTGQMRKRRKPVSTSEPLS